MFALPEPNEFRLDPNTVFGGSCIPILCLIADFLTFKLVLKVAPGALLALYVLGIGSLVLASFVDPLSRLMGFLAGMLTAASAATCLLAFAVAQIGIIVAISGFGFVMGGEQSGAKFLAFSVLAFAPLWTAWVSIRRARLTIAASYLTHGPSEAAKLGISGAFCLVAVAFWVELTSRHWLLRL